MPFVNVMAAFREDVRKIAREEKVTGILKLCDEVRDDKLVEIGVKLEDQEGADFFFIQLAILIRVLVDFPNHRVGSL